VFAAIERKATPFKVKPAGAELIGLIPEAAFDPHSAWVQHLHGFDPAEKVLERRLENPLSWPDAQI
jgi:glutamate formiminotransferase